MTGPGSNAENQLRIFADWMFWLWRLGRTSTHLVRIEVKVD